MHEHMYKEIDKQMKAVLIITDKNTKQQNTVKQEGFLAQLPCCRLDGHGSILIIPGKELIDSLR